MPVPASATKPERQGIDGSRRARQQSQEHRRRDSAGASVGGHRRFRLGQIDARQRHSLPRPRREALPLDGKAGGASRHSRRRAHRQGRADRPGADRAHPALESRHLYRRVHPHSRNFRDASGIARARLQAGPLQLQREGRPLRGLPGRRPAPHRNEFSAGRLRYLRSVPRQALQRRNARRCATRATPFPICSTCRSKRR